MPTTKLPYRGAGRFGPLLGALLLVGTPIAPVAAAGIATIGCPPMFLEHLGEGVQPPGHCA